MKIEPTVFREYDIRGRESDKELNPESMSLIGQAYGTFLRKRQIAEAVIGHDDRATSVLFKDALVEGMISTGCNVIDIGLVTTPMLYWSQFYLKRLGAAAVTASHNPSGWNGVKMASGYSRTTNQEEIEEIRQVIESGRFADGKGQVSKANIVEAYIADLTARVKLRAPLRVLLNTGNGTAGFIAPRLLKRAGCEVVELNTDLDPTFPHYTPNPSVAAMMEDTGAHVRSSQAAAGIAIDADGDRLGVTDEKGDTVWPDLYMIPAVRNLLAEKAGGKVVFDVKCSQALDDEIRQHGGTPIMWKTGHSFIKEKIQEDNADLGIEMSGHIFFVHGYYGFDDALFAALKLVELLSARGVPLSQLLADVPRYSSSPVYNAYCSDEEKYQIVEELVGKFKAQGYRVIEISGARVVFDDGWGLVRASSNLPQLVLRFEARTPERLAQIEQMFRTILRQYKSVGEKWETG